jgi:hypothetical protein
VVAGVVVVVAREDVERDAGEQVAQKSPAYAGLFVRSLAHSEV